VICDFPGGCNQLSYTRLTQVIDHGARCGVLALVLADPAEPSPPGVTLSKVAAQAVHLARRDGRFFHVVWLPHDRPGDPA
jgi:16S rRNA G1207 methylase RsmC